MNFFVNKSDLYGLVEDFILSRLNEKKYSCGKIKAKNLLTWNRLDLAFKLFYLDLHKKNNTLAKYVYREDIRSQTLGTFKEFGNSSKNTFDRYLEDFESIYSSIKEVRYDSAKALVPLSAAGTIVNGAHRVASAIHLGLDVGCVRLELPVMTCDYRYFYDRGVSEDTLDKVVSKFIEYADDVYVAFLWPSIDVRKEAEELAKFDKIVFQKDILLNHKGAFNLISEIYKGMDWVGHRGNGYRGVKAKLVECFKTFKKFKVVFFQAESLDRVREIKQEVRDIYNIGFSAIHITDTKEEAIRVSGLILNHNGLHFLNNANPHKYPHSMEALDLFLTALHKSNVEPRDVMVDGSMTLAAYGLRESKDIDYLSSCQIDVCLNELDVDAHDSELDYHKVSKESLIYDQNYYFQYSGLKLVSLRQLYAMKSFRKEEKDIIDCDLMESCFSGSGSRVASSKIKQFFFYQKIKQINNLRNFSLMLCRITGVYYPLRFLYRRYFK